MFCNSCGAEVGKRTLICPQCGSKDFEVRLTDKIRELHKNGRSQAEAQLSQSEVVQRVSSGDKPSKVNAGLLISLAVLVMVMGLLFTIAVYLGEAGTGVDEDLIIFLILATSVCMLVSAIYFMISLYRAWSVIQGAGARMTPGKAVGFLFIPVFSLYWVFQAYWGWSKDYNSYIQSRGHTQAPVVSTGLFLTHTIMLLFTVVPLLGDLVMIALIPIVIMSFSQLARATNYLIDND